MICTRCKGEGFLNIEQVPDDVLKAFDESGDKQVVVDWIKQQTEPHDVQVCDCCGDGENWYGEAGHHHLGAEEPFPECY